MSTCSQCGLQVRWIKVDGRWHCHNADGADHWDLCSKTRFERIKREGRHFVEPKAEGYVHPEKLQFVRLNAKPIRGTRYVPDGCTCGLPPWELCKPDCASALRRPH